MAGGGQDDDDLMNFVPERLTDEGEANGSGGKSKSLLMASALIGVAVAGAAGWYLLAGGSTSDGRVSAPLIPADQTPYKVRPADPGGMKVPNQDKLVYDRLDPDNGSRPEVETLLPEPASPSVPDTTVAVSRLPKMDTDAPMTPPPPPALDGEDAASQGIRIRIPDEEMAVAPPQKAAPVAPPAPQTEPAPEPKAEAKPAPKAAPEPEPEAEAETSPEPVVKDTPPEPVKPTAEATETTGETETETVAKAQGDYMIQLASMRSEDAAREAWTRMQKQFPGHLGPLTLAVQRADLGDKGIFYRVRATGLATEEKARDVCAALAKDKVGCLFVGKQ